MLKSFDIGYDPGNSETSTVVTTPEGKDPRSASCRHTMWSRTHLEMVALNDGGCPHEAKR